MGVYIKNKDGSRTYVQQTRELRDGVREPRTRGAWRCKHCGALIRKKLTECVECRSAR